MTRALPVLAALSVMVVAATAARPGYLSDGRLAPLRFATAPGLGRFVLPPFPAPAPPANIPIPTNTTTTSTSNGTLTSSAERFEDAPVPATNEVVVTPQMLLGYYRDGTSRTNHDGQTVVPFGFVPPTPAPQQSSSAQYSSP